ncbi:MAG TPA: hypothetical protein VK137_19640, partial [Planctomycetaceae bacterium]|nr:hypothetical protein [Planctomycetaceae bacterium]
MSAVILSATHAPVASPTPLRRWLAVFTRMIWKELRSVRPFWLSVVGAIVAFGGLVLWLGHGEQWRDSTLGVVAVIFPLLYAL